MKTVRWVAVCGLALLAMAGGAGASGPGFPSAGIDMISHELTVGLYKVGPNGENEHLLETLLFKGRMMIERGDPFYNNDIGRRQVNFTVLSWEADGWSDKLNSLVVYRLSKTPQKTSTITAQEKGTDFPAFFDFNVTFDALVYGEEVVTEFEGSPDGGSFMEVPPSGNRRTSPTMTQFESARIETDHPLLGRIRLVPIACNDEEGITMVTFSEEQKRLLKQQRQGKVASR